MSRTYRQKEGIKFKEGRPTREVPYICRCEWCTSRERQKLREKVADQEIERAIKGDDLFFGSWYEGMEGEEILEEYWNKEWELNKLSDQIMREAA